MKTMVLGILSAPDEYNIKVPGISENITRYNKILKEVFGDFFIDTNDITPDCLMSDFHHLNKKGHAAIFEKIQSKINL
jgi:lysophospholipase L1-like esterase